MATTGLQCTVLTPERAVIETAARFVALPAHDGEIGVLHNRAPLLCKLGVGVLRIDTPDGGKRLFVDEGFAEVRDNRVTILTEQARTPDQIDVAEEKAALEEARHRRAFTPEEQANRQRDLARATTKIHLASKP